MGKVGTRIESSPGRLPAGSGEEALDEEECGDEVEEADEEGGVSEGEDHVAMPAAVHPTLPPSTIYKIILDKRTDP